MGTSNSEAHDELANQTGAHLAPGGSVRAVATFLRLLDEGDFRAAGELVDSETLDRIPGGLASLASMDLSYLKEPGWEISRRPRPEGPDSETVVYVFTGSYASDEFELTYPFLVSRSPEGGGWRIIRFGEG